MEIPWTHSFFSSWKYFSFQVFIVSITSNDKINVVRDDNQAKITANTRLQPISVD